MTIEYILSKKFKGVVVDSNLLVLLLIGLFDYDQIEKNRRLNNFEKGDFDKLVLLIEAVSNKTIKSFEEYNTSSNEVIFNNQKAFYKFGLADSSIANLSKEEYLIITADFPLYHFLSSQNLNVINYNHLRFL